MTYFLWDWNGTLLDDTQAALDTLNEMLSRRGRPPIGMDFYRDNFAFPVKPFYESIGVRLDNEDWEALAREYHEVYGRQSKRLNSGAIAALEHAKACSAGQSIISALRQDILERDAARFGAAPYMEHIYGVDNLDGASKSARAVELVRRVKAERRGADVNFVLIGDSLHDKEVADAIGVRCVLCSQGSHAGWRLSAAAPTGATLEESVSMALAGRSAMAGGAK